MQGLKGKVAIVTGGATLIGAAVVRGFQREATKVVIADINEEGGRQVAKSLGSDVLFVKTDLADDAQIAACVESTVANSWHAPADRATLPPGVVKHLRDAGIEN